MNFQGKMHPSRNLACCNSNADTHKDNVYDYLHLLNLNFKNAHQKSMGSQEFLARTEQLNFYRLIYH